MYQQASIKMIIPLYVIFQICRNKNMQMTILKSGAAQNNNEQNI